MRGEIPILTALSSSVNGRYTVGEPGRTSTDGAPGSGRKETTYCPGGKKETRDKKSWSII